MSVAPYSDDYYQTHCGVDDYYHNAEIMRFFDSVASMIVNKHAPRTILDVGCACGHLVRSLRKLGVEAYGVDYSQDALNAAHESVRPFLGRLALPDRRLPASFPPRYDLVVNIEVLEHIERQNALDSIRTLTSFGDAILFSSTPWDKEEITHINVNPVSYWALAFTREGFYPDFESVPDYVSPQAILFRKVTKGLDFHWESALDALAESRRQANARQAEVLAMAQERLDIIKGLKTALDAKEADIAAKEADIAAKEADIAAKEAVIAAKDETLADLVLRNQLLTREVESRTYKLLLMIRKSYHLIFGRRTAQAGDVC